MHDGNITVQLGAELPEVARLTRIVREFGEEHEVPGRELNSINLAVDELVTNAVLYGFDEPRGQKIVVHLELRGMELRATITDEGRAFDPLRAPAPDLAAPLSERPLGGLGVHLARTLADRLDYRRTGGKNVLTLRKKVS